MAHFGLIHCPRCNHDLHTGIASGSPQAGGLSICSFCGWTESRAQVQSQIRIENQTIKAMVATAFLSVVFAAQMFSWGPHAFSAPFLKVGQWTGMLGPQGYNQLAQMCLDLGKIACAKQAYIENFQQNRDLDSLSKLARVQLRNQETQSAMTTFAAYINSGGRDGESALMYGQLLEQAGQDVESLKMMELSIAHRPDTLPIAATGAIVRILMKQGRFEEARTRLIEFHQSAGNAKGYLNTELSQIEQAIKLYKPTKSASKRG